MRRVAMRAGRLARFSRPVVGRVMCIIEMRGEIMGGGGVQSGQTSLLI